MIRRRVAVVLKPRMLGEALARVLAREDLEFVVLTDPGEPQPSGNGRASFDVALISGDLPDWLSVDVVISLPDEAGNAGLGRRTPLCCGGAGEETVEVTDLATVVSLIDRSCPAH